MIALRRLSEVRGREDLVWFRPALERLRVVRPDPDSRVRAFFSARSPIYIARAPGRLDVMGGIADYSGARVLELPLECATAALLQWRGTPRCDIAPRRGGRGQFCSVDLPLGAPAELAAWFAARHDDRWASYVVGIVQHCLARTARAGRSVPGGGL